jgi:membrane protease YdiL (CAAX protease family)
MDARWHPLGGRSRLPTARIDRRRLVAVALPVVMPGVMRAVFTIGRDHLGERIGYEAGFGAYWGICGALSAWLIGPSRVRELLGDRQAGAGSPAALEAALLLWPPAGAIATRFIPEVGEATPGELATSAGVALVNATLEEVFWRGVYISLWPENPWLGWIWPALGFGAWHLAPQAIHPASMGRVAYVASATALGLSWGCVAYRTGSVRWTTLSHLLTDGSGLRNARYFLGS